MKRSFTSVVRITSYVLLAVTIWKRKFYLKQVERKQRNESDLKSLNFKEPTFSLFNVLTAENQVNTKLTDYFAVNGVVLTETAMKGKIIRLNDSHWYGLLVPESLKRIRME